MSRPITIDGVRYPSLTTAAQARGCSVVNVHKLARRHGVVRRGTVHVDTLSRARAKYDRAVAAEQRAARLKAQAKAAIRGATAGVV